jgi:hypothetical protein
VSATTAFHGAAALLIDQAPVEVVKKVLRLLLAEELATEDAVPEKAASPFIARVGRHARKFRHGRTSAPGNRVATAGTDSEWESLRHQIHQAMRTRGKTVAALAEIVGCSTATTKVAIYRTRPPSHAMTAKLKAWLEAPPPDEPVKPAPEVAEAVLPFRSIAAQRHGRNHGNGAGAPTAAPATAG